MWKIALAFVAFAALAMFILIRSGGDIDLSGEKHGADATGGGTAEPAASAPAVAVPSPPASQ